MKSTQACKIETKDPIYFGELSGLIFYESSKYNIVQRFIYLFVTHSFELSVRIKKGIGL
jgi:hypothetical protein